MSTLQDRLPLLQRKAERIQNRMDILNARSNRYKMQQFMLFIGAFLLSIPTLAIARWLGLIVIAAAVIVLALLIRWQHRVDRAYIQHQTLLRLTTAQIARVRLDWGEIPAVPPLERQEEHPFDLDLDITGERSLHQLLNTGVSYGGILLLQKWLLNRVPDLESIRQRQALVSELVPLTRFRHKLLLHSLFATRFSSEPLEGDRTVSWLGTQLASASKQRVSSLLVATFLSVLLYASVLLFIYAHISPLFCVGSFVLSLVWFFLTQREQGNLAEDASYMRFSFGQLRSIFQYLETYRYAKHSQLRMLCEPFYLHSDHKPSQLLNKLERIMRRANLASNSQAWPFLNALFPVGAYTAYQLDRYKVLLNQYLPTWLSTWYQLEALCSLANFAYLNPEYRVPRISSGKIAESEPLCSAQSLGHPLLPKEKKVTNDFSLDKLGDVLLITGSNMAGKSTFLRTIGINLCLALAGGVVNASSLHTQLFQLYACIRVTDSLADGYSYFYAEVRRLRGLLTELEQGTSHPLFFLIDEIFKGTNNYERLIGSEAYIRALVGKRCLGAISTHDLELVKLADSLPEIRNVHFREDIANGKMVFDYLLRSGPSPTRNALRIMQMEGLPVQWETSSGHA